MNTQTEQSYNGWSNRETWCLALWLYNDEGLSNTVQKLVRKATRGFVAKRTESEPKENFDDAVYTLTKDLQRYVDDLIEERDMCSEGFRIMFDDIGSLHRISWHELASSFIENA